MNYPPFSPFLSQKRSDGVVRTFSKRRGTKDPRFSGASRIQEPTTFEKHVSVWQFWLQHPQQHKVQAK